MAKIKLKEWAEKHGLSYITANRHFHLGLIPNATQLDSGTILVEDDTSEQTMLNNSPSNDAMSLFLKKTVEFSKNNATVEDFAAYVISNFTLKINGTEAPRYSRQKPKSEDVQKHFQQFIPKGEKPKPNSFVLEPDTLDDLQGVSKPVNSRELLQEFKQAMSAPEHSPAFTPTSAEDDTNAEAMSPTEGMITRSVDLSTPQQQINYTGSLNPTFSGSLVSPTFTVSGTSDPNIGVSSLMCDTNSSIALNSALPSTSSSFAYGSTSGGVGLYFSSNYAAPDDTNAAGAFQLTQKEIEAVKNPLETQSLGPKRRGRKPIKR